jgi:hypothetical protein
MNCRTPCPSCRPCSTPLAVARSQSERARARCGHSLPVNRARCRGWPWLWPARGQRPMRKFEGWIARCLSFRKGSRRETCEAKNESANRSEEAHHSRSREAARARRIVLLDSRPDSRRLGSVHGRADVSCGSKARLGQSPVSSSCWQTQKSLSTSAPASATAGSQRGRAPVWRDWRASAGDATSIASAAGQQGGDDRDATCLDAAADEYPIHCLHTGPRSRHNDEAADKVQRGRSPHPGPCAKRLATMAQLDLRSPAPSSSGAGPAPQPSAGTDLGLEGVVEPALARALVLAAEAGRWEIVEQIARELTVRRQDRQDTTPPVAVRLHRSSARP